MSDERMLKQTVRQGMQARELLDNEYFSAILDRLVTKYHDDMMRVNMADDPNGNNTKLAVLAYNMALQIKQSLLSAAQAGDTADKILSKDRH